MSGDKKHRTRVVLLLAFISSVGCALHETPALRPEDTPRGRELVRWTRTFESEMGLPMLQIDFMEKMEQGHCGFIESTIWVDAGGIVRIPGVVYSLATACSRTWSAKELALHETLHWRLAHDVVNMTEAEKHAELKRFARYYRNVALP